MPRGYVLASVPLSLNTERLAMLKHQIAGPGQRKCSEGRALLAYGFLSHNTRVDIVNHWQMPLKLACRGKAGGVGELLCTLLPARSMVPDMITIYCRKGEFLVTAGAVVILKFGAKLHNELPRRREVDAVRADTRKDM